MTFDIFSIVILVLALCGLVLGWKASLVIGRLLLVLWRLGVAACFGLLAVYCFYVAWPYLVELQDSGQVYFPRGVADWSVVVTDGQK